MKNPHIITVDFGDYSFVYTESVANQIFRGLLEAMPNKYNHVYESDLDMIINNLQIIKASLKDGKIFTSENCKTLGI